jgi:hypothetical protein
MSDPLLVPIAQRPAPDRNGREGMQGLAAGSSNVHTPIIEGFTVPLR